jgi:hypothetical protein
MSGETRKQWEWASLKEEVLCETEGCRHPDVDHACRSFHYRLGLAMTGQCSVEGCSCRGAAGPMDDAAVETSWTISITEKP